jgi:hypothetical protein
MNNIIRFETAARLRVRELVANFHFSRAGLGEIAALLPENDDELHAWLEQTIAKREENDFIFIIFAAAMQGRKLRASLLPASAILMPDENRFAWIAWRMEGDVGPALLAVADGGGITTRMTAMAYYIAAAWWMKNRPEEDVPCKIAAGMNELSTKFGSDSTTGCYLGAFFKLLGGHFPPCGLDRKKVATAEQLAKKTHENIQAMLAAPFEDHIPEKEARDFISNATVRRAVEKFGRNEPCHCGSGKKYKRCCYEKDQERLRHCSDVAGKTREEVTQDLNADLTKRRLENFRPVELLRLDPVRVPPELQSDYLLRLGAFKRYDALAEAFEKLGVPPELNEAWIAATIFALQGWRRDTLERLAKARPDEELAASSHLLLASDDPAKFFATLEAESLKALQSGDENAVPDIAMGLLCSPYRALAILLARGTLPLVRRELATPIYDDILKARAELNLSPDDAFADFMEERAARERPGDEAEAVQEKEAQLAELAKRTRALKEEVASVKRALALQEKKAKRNSAANEPAQPDASEEAKELRTQLKKVEALLRETSAERVLARRDRDRLEQENELLRIANGIHPAEAAEADDEATGDPLEVKGQQPVRFYRFAEKFEATMMSFPRDVGAAAMGWLARLASGDPHAFMGVKKIYECDGVLEARVAGDYRLLFQLSPKHIRVIDLVNRRDLPRRLKGLRSGGLPGFAA